MAGAAHAHRSNPGAVFAATEVRKRLFVFCDGTWQDGVNKTRPLTNVATLARCLMPVDGDGCLQIVYYDGGVGNAAGALSQLIDGATGRGISAKIRNAYSFLSHNYNFSRHWDETVLVGFSRGAFAVQCLAAFISDAGLLEKQHLYYLRGLFRLWAVQKMPGGETKFRTEQRRLESSGLLHRVKITACAVWDTVSALGSRIRIPPRPLSFVGRTVPSCVQNAFQALALDEERPDFRPLLWECPPADNDACVISQCWFLGSHGDVGGNGDAALGALTFLWMVGKLHDKVGVAFDDDEIAKHLKHKFLEWDFSVNKVLRTFKETRTLSIRRHEGQTTPHAWYWRLLGRQSRSNYLRMSGPLPTEIHFTVRLAMAEKKNECRPLKSWTTSWTAPNTPTKTRAQWRPPQRSPGGDQAVTTINEHPLSHQDKEYDLLFRWSYRKFRILHTDRGDFVVLQKAIQDPGANMALDSFAELLRDHLKDHLKFEDAGNSLVGEVLYQGGKTGEQTDGMHPGEGMALVRWFWHCFLSPVSR